MNRLMPLPPPCTYPPKMFSAMLTSLFSFMIRCNLSTLKARMYVDSIDTYRLTRLVRGSHVQTPQLQFRF